MDAPVAGTTTSKLLATNVVLVTATGHLGPERLKEMQAAANDMIAKGIRAAVFWDVTACPTVDTAFRRGMTGWHTEIEPKLQSQSVLVASQIVAMAVTVVGMLTGGVLKMYSSRTKFEAALAAAVQASSNPR
jgi:hypothetical protein